MLSIVGHGREKVNIFTLNKNAFPNMHISVLAIGCRNKARKHSMHGKRHRTYNFKKKNVVRLLNHVQRKIFFHLNWVNAFVLCWYCFLCWFSSSAPIKHFTRNTFPLRAQYERTKPHSKAHVWTYWNQNNLGKKLTVVWEEQKSKRIQTGLAFFFKNWRVCAQCVYFRLGNILWTPTAKCHSFWQYPTPASIYLVNNHHIYDAYSMKEGRHT